MASKWVNDMGYRLYGRAGWGSVIIESQLQWYDIPFELQTVEDVFASESARAQLAQINPLAQLPTLVLPDGRVMTESAAITLHLADVAAAQGSERLLVPMQTGPERDRFLRWLLFIVANVYPTFTYADDPSRFVSDKAAQQSFRARVDIYAQRLYAQLESEAAAPWFLGERLSAIDFYVATLVHWRPGPAWFSEQAPRLFQIAVNTVGMTPLLPAWARNFPEALVPGPQGASP